jgi:hypothetical protein
MTDMSKQKNPLNPLIVGAVVLIFAFFSYKYYKNQQVNKIKNDILPSIVASGAVFTRIYTWVVQLNLNEIIVTLTGIAGLVYLLMKMCYLYLEIKEKRRKSRDI